MCRGSSRVVNARGSECTNNQNPAANLSSQPNACLPDHEEKGRLCIALPPPPVANTDRSHPRFSGQSVCSGLLPCAGAGGGVGTGFPVFFVC